MRAKALQGPIGVDNSEVINLEMEREHKRKSKNLANHNAAATDNEDDEEGLCDEDRENLKNQKLLNRLYRAADMDNQQPDNQQVRFSEGVKDGSDAIDQQNRALIE